MGYQAYISFGLFLSFRNSRKEWAQNLLLKPVICWLRTFKADSHTIFQKIIFIALLIFSEKLIMKLFSLYTFFTVYNNSKKLSSYFCLLNLIFYAKLYFCSSIGANKPSKNLKINKTTFYGR